MDPLDRGIPNLPVIRFDLGGGGYGPNRWCATVTYRHRMEIEATLSGPDYTCQFCTTNLHFCKDCVLEAFKKGVAAL